MNILDVSPAMVNPPRTAAAARVHQLLRHLSKRNEVRQFSQTREPDAQEELWAAPSYFEHRYREPAMAGLRRTAGRLLLLDPFDTVMSGWRLRWLRPRLLSDWIEWANVVIVESPWQFSYCRRRAKKIPVVLSLHRPEAAPRTRSDSLQSVRREQLRRKAIEKRERPAVQQADLIIVSSTAERLALLRDPMVKPERVLEIPDGVDTDRIRPLDPHEKAVLRRSLGLPPKPTVIFSTPAHCRAAAAGFDRLRQLSEKLPDFTFLAGGGVYPRALRHNNLICVGEALDPTPYLQAADYAIFPVSSGLPLTAYWEAFAAGLPSVVFASALPSLGARDLEHLLAAHNRADGLEAALRGLDGDAALARSLSHNARDLVEARFDWRALAGRLEQALRSLVGLG